MRCFVSTRQEFPELPPDVIDMVEPEMHPAGNIGGCEEIQIGNYFKDPDTKEKGAEYIYGHQLLERRVDEGWKVVTICWKRDDGHTNFGHEPAIKHVLVAVIIKLTEAAEKYLNPKK